MKKRYKKNMAIIIAGIMVLTIIPFIGCEKSHAKTNGKTVVTKTQCPANKGNKTTKTKCPTNKGKKSDNGIYLYKVGTKGSKKVKTIHVYQTKYLSLKNICKVKSVKWKSSNKKVAKVSKQGVLTGIKKGKATITAKVKKQKFQIKIKVKAPLSVKNVNGSQLKQGIYMTDYYSLGDSTLVKYTQNKNGIGISYEKAKNVLISPASINMVLGMVANGSSGKILGENTCGTIPNEKVYVNPKKEIEKYLGKNTKDYNEYAKKIMNANDGKTLKMANSVWYKKDSKLNNDFESNVKNFYKATTNEISFDDSGKEQINKWASDNTDGMIDKVIDNISPDAYAYIMNATLFDAKWTSKFDSSDVRKQNFKMYNGKKVKTDIMYGSADKYYENDYAFAFEKTYEKDKKYSFIGILPKTKGDFRLENLNIPQLLNQKKKGTVKIGIPKFEYKWRNNISSAMINNGVTNIFNRYVPALNPMFNTTDSYNKYIDEVIHSTAIKVDTEGTKAAAVTAVIVKVSSLTMYDKKIILNRPFAYLIRNNKTGEILFVGKVIDPTQK